VSTTPQLFDLKTRLEAALPALTDAVKAQAAAAVAELAQGSQEAADLGLRCLEALANLGGQVARCEVSAEAAKIALDEYLDAVEVAGEAVGEKAKSEAYDRGLALLQSVSQVLLGLLDAGLKAGAANLPLLVAALA
jgi:intracellular sulfur oxidation DsrE/DsrF family protein